MITMGLHDVRLDSSEIHRLMTSDGGDVAGHIRHLGEDVVVLAMTKVGKRTGRLLKSIRMRKDSNIVGGYAVLVGSDVNYAWVHHSGSRPHVIRAKGNGMLRFRGRNGVVFARSVNHPGTRPNQYLVDSLRAVVR
jgi:hypothetical protein